MIIDIVWVLIAFSIGCFGFGRKFKEKMRLQRLIIILFSLLLFSLFITGCSPEKPHPKTTDDILFEEYFEQMEAYFAAWDEFDNTVDNPAATQDELIEKMNKYVEVKRKLSALEEQVLLDE